MTSGQEQQQLYLYRCASCGSILKETETPIDSSILRSLHERCTCCDCELQERTIAMEKTAVPRLHLTSAPSLLPSIERAYDLQSRLTFDIPEIDSMHDLGDRGAICVTSRDGWHANTLVTRACVRALMPKRHGGMQSPSVLFIDAGNCSDIYQCVKFARQYGMDSEDVLDRIIVSRPFTITQLAGLIVHELDRAVRHTSSKLVVISDLLKMFVEDPQIDRDEIQWLLREITKALRKQRTRSLLLVSLRAYPSFYPKLLSIFDATIEIADSKPCRSTERELDIKVSSLRFGSKTNALAEKALQLVPPR